LEEKGTIFGITTTQHRASCAMNFAFERISIAQIVDYKAQIADSKAFQNFTAAEPKLGYYYGGPAPDQWGDCDGMEFNSALLLYEQGRLDEPVAIIEAVLKFGQSVKSDDYVAVGVAWLREWGGERVK
jgi:hypothetical protein